MYVYVQGSCSTPFFFVLTFFLSDDGRLPSLSDCSPSTSVVFYGVSHATDAASTWSSSRFLFVLTSPELLCLLALLVWLLSEYCSYAACQCVRATLTGCSPRACVVLCCVSHDAYTVITCAVDTVATCFLTP